MKGKRSFNGLPNTNTWHRGREASEAVTPWHCGREAKGRETQWNSESVAVWKSGTVALWKRDTVEQ